MITQLLDGDMGQELINRCGKSAHPLWSAKLLIDQPQMIQAVHAEYIMATLFVTPKETRSYDPVKSNNGRDLDGKGFKHLIGGTS